MSGALAQRDQAQKWNQQRKSAASGQDPSEKGAATTQQDVQSSTSPTGAYQCEHVIQGSVTSYEVTQDVV